MLVWAIVSGGLTISCIFLNVSLIIYCLTMEEFRNWDFFSICFQASIDTVGLGIGNLVYEILAYRNFISEARKEELGIQNNFSVTKLLECSDPETILGCVLTYLRSILKEDSTSLCILATAFIHYILVCHSTSNYLTDTKLRLRASLIVVLTGCTLVANLLDMKFNFFVIREETCDETFFFFHSSMFVYRCVGFYYRRDRRILIEASIFMIVPWMLSGYFYFSISRDILKREHDVERNRNLSIFFCISWIVWIICWAPNYTFMLSDLFRHIIFANISFGYLTFKYLSLYGNTFQMLYSQVNPFPVLIVLKPFRIMVKEIFLQSLMLQKKNVEGGKENSRPQKENLSSPKKLSHKFHFFHNCTALILIVSFLLVALFFSFFMIDSTIFGNLKSRRLKNSKGALQSLRKQRMVAKFEMKELHVFLLQGPKTLCGMNHAFVGYNFKRWFFSLRHNGAGLIFTHQVISCEKRQAVLFYPRDVEKINHVWRFYSNSFGWDINGGVQNIVLKK